MIITVFGYMQNNKLLWDAFTMNSKLAKIYEFIYENRNLYIEARYLVLGVICFSTGTCKKNVLDVFKTNISVIEKRIKKGNNL